MVNIKKIENYVLFVCVNIYIYIWERENIFVLGKYILMKWLNELDVSLLLCYMYFFFIFIIVDFLKSFKDCFVFVF